MSKLARTLVQLLPKGTEAFLDTQNVSAEQYALWLYTDAIRKTTRTGYMITAIITLVLTTVSSIAVTRSSIATPPSFKLFLVILFGGLGLFIGLMAVRLFQGKGSENIEYADYPLLTGYITIMMQDRSQKKHLEAITEKEWGAIRNFAPDLSKKIYQRAIVQPRDRKIRITPRQTRLIRRISRIRKFFGWAILPGAIMFPFTEKYGMTFLMLCWFCIGMWLLLDSMVSFIEGKLEMFGDYASLVYFGWQAKVYSVILMVVAASIFVLPGLAGITETFGVVLF